MQRTSAQGECSASVTETSAESFCLVCDAALVVESSTNIFYTSLPRNGELLASFVLRVLRPVASDLRSSYICSRCNELFQMLEQAQWTVSNIRCEILKVYHSRESEKALEGKGALAGAEMLSEVMFVEPEQKPLLGVERFDEINEFRVLDVPGAESIARGDVFDPSPAGFCDLSIEIDDGVKKIETPLEIRDDDVYGSKLDCLKSLEANRGDFDGSPNDFCDLNIGIDKKVENLIESRQNGRYQHKISCSETLEPARDGGAARRNAFDDPPSSFCDLNIVMEGTEKKVGELMEIRQNSVYERKIDCAKAPNDERVGSAVGGNAFEDSPSGYCNLNIEIASNEEKLQEPLENSGKVVYEPKIDRSRIEQSAETPEDAAVERGFKKCSKNARNLAKDSPDDSLRDPLDISAEEIARDDKKARYTLQCRLCPRLFEQASDLRTHTLKHGGSRPYYCRKCNERFSDLTLANGHATEMHSARKNCIAVATKPLDNEVVDFTGDDWILPEEPENREDTESSDKISDRSAKNGRISKYSLKPLKYPCATCGKKWRTSAELKTHVKSHSNLRPYMCEKCGQAYKHKHALEIHVGMHNGISPYQCSVCNKCFTQKGALMRHLPMHTGEMPYQCELCGKRFVHHTSYNMHELSHTGKKSYQCHVCDLSLLSTSHLKRHMRVHTGEKPYSCELCGKSFAERYNLFAHQKIHDPAEIMAKAAKKNTYKCEQCDELFDKKQKLDEHTKEHHSAAANGRKWIGHALELESPAAKAGDELVDQSWQDYNYSKLQSVVVGMKKSPRLDNSLSQMSHETVALLMSQMAVMIQPANSTTSEIDHSQI